MSRSVDRRFSVSATTTTITVNSRGEAFGPAFISSHFLPTWLACGREHRNATSIFIVNVFLGWTFIGWVVALAWAATENVEGAPKETPQP
jgi:hypothetical protein